MKKATVKEIKRATTQNVRSNLESVCIVRDSPWIENEDEYSSDFSINLFFDSSSAEERKAVISILFNLSSKKNRQSF